MCVCVGVCVCVTTKQFFFLLPEIDWGIYQKTCIHDVLIEIISVVGKDFHYAWIWFILQCVWIFVQLTCFPPGRGGGVIELELTHCLFLNVIWSETDWLPKYINWFNHVESYISNFYQNLNYFQYILSFRTLSFIVSQTFYVLGY